MLASPLSLTDLMAPDVTVDEFLIRLGAIATVNRFQPVTNTPSVHNK